MIALLALACGGAVQAPTASAQPVLVATVKSKRVAESDPVELTVEARQNVGWTVDVSPPMVEGLDVALLERPDPVDVGDASLLTWRYQLTGDPGSYVVEPGTAQITDPDGQTSTQRAAPIFVDIGVVGPSSQVSDFQAPPAPLPTPWGFYAALGVGVIALAAGGFALWRWRELRPEPVASPEPPHVLARREWAALRAQGLSDHAQALALSRVLRTYIEAITGWPATMRTGTEILRFMESKSVAGPAARLHAGRILDATDRLKFAREGGGTDFFAALDGDFDVVIEATRPVRDAP